MFHIYRVTLILDYKKMYQDRVLLINYPAVRQKTNQSSTTKKDKMRETVFCSNRVFIFLCFDRDILVQKRTPAKAMSMNRIKRP